jgi:peptide/nickel transport system substrate-binding protein
MRITTTKHRALLQASASLAVVGMMLLAGYTAAIGANRASHIQGAPGYGGTMSLRNTTPDCLDPQKTGLGASNAVDAEVLDTLVTVDFKNHISPGLSTKYKVTSGGTVITFFLRHGVTFSNGDPLTAASVKFTFDRAVDPATKSPLSAGDLAQVLKTQVVNTYTVRVVLKTPFRPLLFNMATAFLGILDKKSVLAQGTNTCTQIIGSGPFKIQSVGPGFSDVTLVRNDRHNWEPPWDSNQGKAYLAKLVFKSITSDSTAISELLSGALDYSDVPGTQLSRVQGNSSIKLHKQPVTNEVYMLYNTGRAPFNNNQVRKAFSEAIDRKAIVTAALQGLGIVDEGPIPSSIPYYDKGIKKFSPQYNPTDAQRIFSANHVTGPFDLLIYGAPTYTSAAQIIQAELGALGVKINIDSKAPADWIAASAGGKFDLNLLPWAYPDPDILYLLFDSSQGGGKGLNFTNYVNPTLDGYLVKGRETLNQKKAIAAYRSAQRLIMQNNVIDPLVSASGPVALRTRIHGYRFHPLLGLIIDDLYVVSK